MMYLYVYHKASFTFEASFSTPTCKINMLKFYKQLDEHSWKHDLHNSMQTFSIGIVQQFRTVKGILVLNTTQGQ